MSTRRVANIASTKKRDDMKMQFMGPGLSPTISQELNVTGGSAGTFATSYLIGNVTARTVDQVASGNPAKMSTDRPYIRGIKENLIISSDDSTHWRWRRIVFRAKDPRWHVVVNPANNDTIEYPVTLADGSGVVHRPAKLFNGTDTADTSYRNAFLNGMFMGTQNTDYQNSFTARTNTDFATVIYDRTRTLMSSNDSGFTRQFGHWIPYNGNLYHTYKQDGDESGIGIFSTTGAKGKGDVYILDMFQGSLSAGADNVLNVQGTSTLYWHEK